MLSSTMPCSCAELFLMNEHIGYYYVINLCNHDSMEEDGGVGGPSRNMEHHGFVHDFTLTTTELTTSLSTPYDSEREL